MPDEADLASREDSVGASAGAQGARASDRARARSGAGVSNAVTSTLWGRVLVACGMLILALIAAPLASVTLRAPPGDPRLIDQEERALRIQIGLALAALSHEQHSLTMTEEALLHVLAGDASAIHAAFGLRAHRDLGHDAALIVDGADRPIYAMAAGRALAPDDAAEVDRQGGRGAGATPGMTLDRETDARFAALLPLITRARQAMIAGEARGGTVVRDLLMIDGKPSLVSVRPIVPQFAPFDLAPGTEPMHAAVRHIDGRFLEALRSKLGFTELELVTSVERLQRQTLLIAGSGEFLGLLSWTGERSRAWTRGEGAQGSFLLVLLAAGFFAYLCLMLVAAVGRLRREEERARAHVLTDPLTGLPNRHAFQLRLAERLAHQSRRTDGVAVYYLDLDGFKNVNDALGHGTGDELVREFGARLTAITPEADMIARLGGDEFAVVCCFAGKRAAVEGFARRILEAMEAPFVLGDQELVIGCSIGITCAGAEATLSPSEVMRRTDIALYQAKGTGKAKFCLFDESFDMVVREKRAIEDRLRAALAEDAGLWLAFQPIFDIGGSSIRGAEALLRWDDPELGRVSPSKFIPVAEERGLMGVLGFWVLKRACAAACALDLPFVAVNISSVQFRQPDIVDLVLDSLRETGLSPERLQLEITEGLILDAAPDVAASILKLRFAGVKVALDDFGTGYSSLGYLTRYRVDKIKIDRSFVARMAEDQEAEAVVKALLDLALALRLDVTVEGVETPRQWSVLRRLGRPELQGFLFAEPLPAPALAARLAEQAAGSRALASAPAGRI